MIFFRPSLRLLALLPALCAGLSASYLDTVRYNELVDTLQAAGTPVPTGAGVTVTQVEASLTADDLTYLPDTANPAFAGVTFNDQTGGGQVSHHATNVGLSLYGSGAMAPDLAAVDVYSASDWINSGWSSGTPPTEPNPLQNHSWVTWLQNANASLRLDHAAVRDGFLPIAGLYNADFGDQTRPSDIPDTYGSIYNGITVGRSDGGHRAGTTAFDGSGRVKPEIVAPDNFTSFAAPKVTAAAALLIDAAGADPAAAEPLTLKAVLLAAADKSPFPTWDQTSTRPIDETYGAGQLDVYEAYFIQNAGPQSPGSTLPDRGWSRQSLGANGSHQYNIAVPAGFGLRNLSVLLTWQREVSRRLFGYSPTLADMALSLAPTGGSPLHTSDSPVDNLEHLWRDADAALLPGSYSLTVSTDHSVDYALAWRGELFQTYALWQESAFASSPPADRERTADPDGDGLVNLLEQAFGGDPETVDSSIRPEMQVSEVDGSRFLEINFRRPGYDNGLNYTVETTDQLTGTWSSLEADVQLVATAPDGDGFYRHTYRRTAPVTARSQGFLRVRIIENSP